ncbi:GNAT family N-acetyltransferase [Pseudomonas fulva]|nr:GNAT family N-acetyltransferase [Pseudomonas fulva]MBF8780887.1 GNAT family N-acetyltransferase [Pseudomonas fulva]
MPMFHCSPLLGPERRLLDHFYRRQGSRMRTTGDGQPWVARASEIVAGLTLTPVAEGQWLTGLLVAPAWRHRQVASRLVNASLAAAPGPTWLFCHPDLLPFYQRLAFVEAGELPRTLADRLARYQRAKRLVALVRAQSALASSPGNSTSV